MSRIQGFMWVSESIITPHHLYLDISIAQGDCQNSMNDSCDIVLKTSFDDRNLNDGMDNMLFQPF